MRRWLKVAVPLGLAAVLVAVLAIGFGSPSIDAARGGNGNGKAFGLANGNGNGNGNGESTATVFAEPNPADAGSVVRIQGCGYSTDTWVVVHIEHNGTTEIFGTGVWADGGCIDFPFTTSEPGTYSLEAFQLAKRDMKLVAEGTLEVR